MAAGRVRLLHVVLGLASLCLAAAANYYEVLEVPSDADDAAIKKSYRKLSLKYHPGEYNAGVDADRSAIIHCVCVPIGSRSS